LDVQYDYDGAREELADVIHDRGADRSIWRYLPLLPLDSQWERPPLALGQTPLIECPALARDVGVARYFIKDDSRTPTASSKDRASAVAVVQAKALGFQRAGCASTGNAAVSLAGWCAAAGLQSLIFVPATAPEAKVAQLAIYGARVLLVQGDYGQTWQLAQQAAGELGFYNRNCAVNPYLVEGKKTLGLELGEQLRHLSASVVAMSVGDGCSIAGLGKGLAEMARLGVLRESPRLLGVQAEGAAPLVGAFEAGAEEFQPQAASTVADSIAVGHPRNPIKALRALRQSQGSLLAVSDAEILRAIRDVATLSGVFAEPAAATPLAGIRRARALGQLTAKDTVVHVVTGSGLKDIKAAMSVAPSPERIAPSLDAVREVLHEG
jgi:threonine synthase